RRVPVPARDPDPALERAPFPEGGLTMATAEADVGPIVVADPSERTSARIGRAAAKLPLQLLLLFIAVLWLMPTIGLFFTSLLSPPDFTTNAGGKAFSPPPPAPSKTYPTVGNNPDTPTSLRTTAEIAIGGTILPIIAAALAGYAFAWIDFPGRDTLFVVVIALLVVPLQMALIPVFHLYNTLSLYDTILGLIIFHTAFGLPFAIFLLRNFFIGIP